MRILAAFLLVCFAACSPAEPEIYKTSSNVDDTAIAPMFKALNALTESTLDADAIAGFVADVPMDEESQHTLSVTFNGSDTPLTIHYWREQADWVHVYASSPSKELISLFAEAAEGFARIDGS